MHFRKGLLVVGGALHVENEPKDGTRTAKNIAPSKNKSLKHQKQRATKGLLNFALVG